MTNIQHFDPDLSKPLLKRHVGRSRHLVPSREPNRNLEPPGIKPTGAVGLGGQPQTNILGKLWMIILDHDSRHLKTMSLVCSISWNCYKKAMRSSFGELVAISGWITPSRSTVSPNQRSSWLAKRDLTQ